MSVTFTGVVKYATYQKFYTSQYIANSTCKPVNACFFLHFQQLSITVINISTAYVYPHLRLKITAVG